MKVFITGGAGFIGSHLAERLLANGHGVMVLDNLSTGRMSNIEPLIGQPGFDYRIGSTTDEPLVAELVDRCDVTVHLAAAVGVRLIVEQPVHTIATNVHGTEMILKAVSKKRKPVFIASTSEVYGKRTSTPFYEDDDLVLGPTTHSRWAYACSKALDEWLAFAYARERQQPIIIARFFNTVGPRQSGRYGMVIPTFAKQAVRGEPITVYGSGAQSRCFVHVRDVVEAVERLLMTPEAIGRVFNIGSTEEVTMNGLAEMMSEAGGANSPVVRVPYEEAYAEGFEDMMVRVPSVERLEQTIGFKPTTRLTTIVNEVIEEHRGLLEG